jgi:nucleotidyltransferase-like protein
VPDALPGAASWRALLRSQSGGLRREHGMTEANRGITLMLEVRLRSARIGGHSNVAVARPGRGQARAGEGGSSTSSRQPCPPVRLGRPRGDERPGSDIDLLVDFTTDSSLFDLLRMTRELEDLLGHSVDVVSAGGLKNRDRDILAESVDL